MTDFVTRVHKRDYKLIFTTTEKEDFELMQGLARLIITCRKKETRNGDIVYLKRSDVLKAVHGCANHCGDFDCPINDLEETIKKLPSKEIEE